MGDEIDRFLHDPRFGVHGGASPHRGEWAGMKRLLASTLVALALSAVATPVLADDKSDLHEKLVAGMTAVKSFQQTMVITPTGMVTTSTVVMPDRAKVSVAAGAQTIDMIIAGGDMYKSTNGGPYTKSATPAAIAGQFSKVTVPDVVAILPDKTTGSVTVGVFESSIPTPNGPVKLTCTYDKKTYRLADCSGDLLTQTFSNYDDPKNVIEAPKDAK
jgi:hypothetical protein